MRTIYHQLLFSSVIYQWIVLLMSKLQRLQTFSANWAISVLHSEWVECSLYLLFYDYHQYWMHNGTTFIHCSLLHQFLFHCIPTDWMPSAEECIEDTVNVQAVWWQFVGKHIIMISLTRPALIAIKKVSATIGFVMQSRLFSFQFIQAQCCILRMLKLFPLGPLM